MSVFVLTGCRRDSGGGFDGEVALADSGLLIALDDGSEVFNLGRPHTNINFCCMGLGFGIAAPLPILKVISSLFGLGFSIAAPRPV